MAVKENEIPLHTHIESRKHTVTAQQKIVENTLCISSAHEFSDSLHAREADAENGYDWYFIKQTPKLNGEPGYDEHYAHTRQKVNGESWYVGEGKVALYYVSSYTLQSLITETGSNKNFLSKVDTIKIEPVAINNEETYVSGFGYNIGGAFGIEGGKEGGDSGVKGSASLSWGINFDESVSVAIRDCDCAAYTGGNDNESRVKWVYTFKRPKGKYQKIEGIPDLAHSTFTPENIWIWRIPTKHRNLFKTFQSSVQVNVSSIISRYSGSQSAKIINSGPQSVSDTFDLPFPPLLCCEEQFLTFDKDGGTKHLPIMTEYRKLDFSIIDEKGESCSWVNVKHLQAHTENSMLEISVEELSEAAKSFNNRNCRIIITGNNDNKTMSYQNTSQDLESIQVVVSQLVKPAK